MKRIGLYGPDPIKVKTEAVEKAAPEDTKVVTDEKPTKKTSSKKSK